MPKPESHAVVVGGGVIGVCIAYFLAKRGARVTVLERGDIGKGASYGNAGVIAPGHTPINKPGRVKQALKSVLDPLSPLYVPLRPDPELVSWLWQFRRTCTEGHLEFSMRTLGPLGHATSQLFAELVEREKLECNYRRAGYYETYLTERGLESAKKEASLVRRYGYHPEVLSGNELREREPALKKEIIGGVFCPEAASVNPYQFVVELAERAQRCGVTFRTSTEVVSVQIASGRVGGVNTAEGETVEADAVVLATGAYSGPLIKKLGLRFPLQAAKGYHRDREPREGKTPALHQTCMLGEKSVFCTPMGEFVRFAGTLEFSGVNHEIRGPRLEQLTNAAKLYMDGMGEAESRSEWCGLRPCMSDGLPAVGAVSRYGGLFIATGHAMQGLMLGPITGRLVAESVLDGTPGIDISAFRPERF